MGEALPFMIDARDLTRRFGDLVAVDRLSLQIGKGEIVGLVGPDGAGKTTVLRMLCGLVEPSEGGATVAGFDIHTDLDEVRDRIGYMAQRFGLYADLTVEENMAFYADLFGINAGDRRKLADRLLEMTRMEAFRRREAGQLSGGMKQKLALMCTLLHHPEVLILDEPTNGVDPLSRRDFWAILYRLVKDGLTVLVTTAYLDEAERCNRVGLMHRGRLIRYDAPEAIKGSIEGVCYRVTAPNPRTVKDVLEGFPGVRSVDPVAGAIHLFLSPAETSVEVLEKAIEDRHMGPLVFQQIAPSLEDVFVAMLRESS